MAGAEDSKRIFIVILLLLTANVACAQSEIPSSIVEKSNQYIISKVGADFFNKYIKINYNLSKIYSNYSSPDYHMIYNFKIPEKPYVYGDIEFEVDINGSVILEREPDGIPDCINDSRECEFPVNETMAKQIAKNAGLEDGIAPWKTSFHWCAGPFKTYVWTVSNTLAEYSYSEANGKTVLIDANSGEVKDVSSWAAVSSSQPQPTPAPTSSPTPSPTPAQSPKTTIPTSTPSPTNVPSFEAFRVRVCGGCGVFFDERGKLEFQSYIQQQDINIHIMYITYDVY